MILRVVDGQVDQRRVGTLHVQLGVRRVVLDYNVGALTDFNRVTLVADFTLVVGVRDGRENGRIVELFQ